MRACTILSMLAVLAFAVPASADILINEIDSDTVGTDMLEFIELFGDPDMALDGYVVVLFNGSTDASYNAFDLDGYTLNGEGFFLIGNIDVVPTPDIIIPSNGIQNGADAVALYIGGEEDFPFGTPVTTENLVDAVVYDTDDPDDPGLLVLLLPDEPQLNENMFGNKDFHSLLRCGGGPRETSDWTAGDPTPGAPNDPSCGGGAEPTEMNLCEAVQVDGGGVPVYEGEWVHIIEPLIVLNDYGTVGSGRVDNAATDGECCVYLFDFNLDLPLYEGDEIDVIGTIANYNGKLQISGLEITVLSSGNPLPEPELISTEELAVNGADYESCLIMIDNLYITGGDPWPGEGSNANIEVTDETGVPTTLRIDQDTDIDGTPPPEEPFVAIGLGGQFDNSYPYTEGYQIQPRKLEDIYSEPVFEGACCFGPDCVLMTEQDCLDAQGEWYGDDSCDPNPCPTTPADNSSWGEIKSLYR